MQIKIREDQKKCRAIYRIINEETGDFYVGSSEEPVVRCGHHLARLRKREHANRYLQYAFVKYGEEAFVFEIVTEAGPDENLLAIEQRYLDAYFGEGCYNLCPVVSSTRGRKLSEETKARISASLMGNPRSSETRAKLSAAHKGKTVSAETRAKMSAANILWWKNNSSTTLPPLGSILYR